MSVRDSLIIDWVRGGATVNEVVQQLAEHLRHTSL